MTFYKEGFCLLAFFKLFTLQKGCVREWTLGEVVGLSMFYLIKSHFGKKKKSNIRLICVKDSIKNAFSLWVRNFYHGLRRLM